MNKSVVILSIIGLLLACGEGNTKPVSHLLVTADRLVFPEAARDTLMADPDLSVIHWKGTKMFGLKSHSGIIGLQQGYLLLEEGQPVGGSFTVDMSTIEVTDIPDTDPIPKRGLTNHLKDPDFFDVGNHPQSYLRIDAVKPLSAERSQFSGQLTIRGITNPVNFEGYYKNGHLEATLLFDRFKWNVAYQGSWANRSLIDREVELRVDILLKEMEGYTGTR